MESQINDHREIPKVYFRNLRKPFQLKYKSKLKVKSIRNFIDDFMYHILTNNGIIYFIKFTFTNRYKNIELNYFVFNTVHIFNLLYYFMIAAIPILQPCNRAISASSYLFCCYFCCLLRYVNSVGRECI